MANLNLIKIMVTSVALGRFHFIYTDRQDFSLSRTTGKWKLECEIIKDIMDTTGVLHHYYDMNTGLCRPIGHEF